MNKIIKSLLQLLCSFITWCINKGLILMLKIESLKLYTPNKIPYKGKIRKGYKAYKKNMKKYGLWAPKRDYKVFYKFFIDKGNDPSLIIPSYVPFNLVTPVLNPVSYGSFFEDKNMFDKILPKDFMPETILRKMDNQWYDSNYNFLGNKFLKEYLHDYDIKKRLIIKPSTNTSSGKGISIFKFSDGEWIDNSSLQKLDDTLIKTKWNDNDLIIQEVVEQDSFYRDLCTTAVNTMRIVIYNSPIDHKCHLIWSGLKIAKKGSIVDNSHAGGLVFGIGKNGKLANYGADQNGNKYSKFNGIDFSQKNFFIPNYNEIIEWCKRVSIFLYPHKFISYDIAIDKYGKPKIIEFNLRAYSGWYCQFAGDPMLGDKTDEILNYVYCNRKKGKKFYYSIS